VNLNAIWQSIGITILAAAATAAAEEPLLNVFNWADYVAPDTISDFEAEFGIEVNYDIYDSTEIVEAKLLAGKTGYDVIFHATRYSERLIPIGIYQRLDRTKLPNWKHLDPWVLKIMSRYDPGNLYGVPYTWGTTGFAWNTRLIYERMPDAPVGSGDMIFDPAIASRFADCGITFLDEPTDVIPLAMLYLGHDPNSMDPTHLQEVEALLKSVRPYIRYFSSAKMLIDLPNEEVCIAMSWSGDYAQAMQRARDVGADVRLEYTIPAEGTVAWFDGVFIPSDAPHPDNAHLFMNYLLRPEVIAAISLETQYANANLASLPLLPPELLNDPAVYPSADEREQLKVGYIFSPKAERNRTRIWARMKTGL
jgi:putrescine transport system substrate-binding protein